MNTSSGREAARFPPTSVDVRGCSVFKWPMSSRSLSDPVICQLSPVMRVYVIHPDGRIKKHTPRVVSTGYEDAISYRYVDMAGTLHELGEYRFKVVPRYLPGNKSAEGESRIVDLGAVAHSWRSGVLKYGFSLRTTRPFIGDVALASLFGAMLESGFEDIVWTGFSTEEGKTARGSTTHVNGTNGDFRYLRNDGASGPLHIALELGRPELLDEVRQAAFIAALYRFGWKSMLSYRYQRDGESRLLEGTRHYSNHHHHLHLQGYAPTVEEIYG